MRCELIEFFTLKFVLMWQIPFVVAPEADVALYIDADSIVMCDLEELWDSFTNGPAADRTKPGLRLGWGGEEAMIAAAQDGPHAMYPTPYEKKSTAAMFPRGINAGAFLCCAR